MNNLRPKHKEFIEEYLENGNNATQAVKKVFDIEDSNVASNKASRLLSNATVKQTLAESIPDDLIVEKHKALLNKVDKEGEIDVQAVSKGVDMAYKLKGSYAPEKSINLDLTAEITNPKARELAEKFEEELKKGL